MPDVAPNLKINGKLYSMDDLLDKSIYASKDTNLYRDYYAENPKFIVKKGGFIGVLYSWITRSDGIYLAFITNSTQIKKEYPTGWYFVKASDIDQRTLTEQGVKDEKTKQEEKEEEEKTFTDKLVDSAVKVAKIGIFTYAGITLVKSLINKN